jgi:type IV fimbrial biogenesis protein FimT
MKIATPPLRSLRRPSGFSILELIVAVSVAAILFGIGIPSFMDTLRNNRIAAESNELMTALATARSEATKRGIQVSICPANGNACADTTDWKSGWLVFTDDISPVGSVDGTDAIILKSERISAQVSITSDEKYLTYTPAEVRKKVVFTVLEGGCKGNNKRTISVERTGRVSLVKSAC